MERWWYRCTCRQSSSAKIGLYRIPEWSRKDIIGFALEHEELAPQELAVK